MLPPDRHFWLTAKMNGTQRRTPYRVQVQEEYTIRTVVCQKAPLRTKQCRIKPVALSVIELRLFEGISYLVSQAVS